ncbi:GGDEF domain-containing protein [uncultured Tyzzerella sp.]|uniref:GGDEF domain-containing protein n=1 Tax=uncultured Tyzzerella sp. TaxID=2321398 RepID=UPI0029426D88|nr:GGDEF domain-containing protein [uncultured Tyzzerella sp.]
MGIATIIFFSFNYYIFKYVSKILTNFKKIKLIYILMALTNTSLMLLAYKLKFPYYISYFCVLSTLTIEFLIFSKAKFIQAFICSGILIINISIMQMLFVPIYSYIIGMTPFEMFNDEKMFFYGLALLFIILFIILKISLKFISSGDIIKISTAPVYAYMISTVIMFILLFTIVDVIVLQSKYYTTDYMIMLTTIPILNGILFYMLFFYSIKSVKKVVFKRKSDELELIKMKNNINKKNIEDKILKDDLTACYNRKYIMEDLKDKYKRNIYNFCILFVDIDGLKNVNDNLGHEIGDEYIINVSKVLKNSVREKDIISRIGGDEFIIILTDIKEEEVSIVLDRIYKKIKTLDNLTKDYKVSASIGTIFIDETLLQTGIENIIKIADDKMRLQKIHSKGE